MLAFSKCSWTPEEKEDDDVSSLKDVRHDRPVGSNLYPVLLRKQWLLRTPSPLEDGQ